MNNTNLAHGPESARTSGDDSLKTISASSLKSQNVKRKHDATTAPSASTKSHSNSDCSRSNTVTITPTISKKTKQSHVLTPVATNAAATNTTPATTMTGDQEKEKGRTQNASNENGKDYDRRTSGSSGSFPAIAHGCALPEPSSITNATVSVSPSPPPDKRKTVDKQTTNTMVGQQNASSPILQLETRKDVATLTSEELNAETSAKTTFRSTATASDMEDSTILPSNPVAEKRRKTSRTHKPEVAAPEVSMHKDDEKEDNDILPADVPGVQEIQPKNLVC